VTLLFVDSFSHYTNPLDKWTGIVGTTNNYFQIAAGIGRNGASGMRTIDYGNGAYGPIVKTIPGGSKSAIIMGFAFSRPNPLLGALTVATFYDGTSNPPNLVEQVRIELNTALGVFRVMRGATVLGQGTTVLHANSFMYIELKALISATVGTIDLHINGAAVELSLTGLNTKGGGNLNIDSVGLWSDGLTPGNIYGDVYVADTLGIVNNNFIGDARVQALLSTGVGAASDWTPNGAAAGWQCVSEVPNDGDTTYISSATPGQRDTFVTSDLASTSGAVKGIQANIVARKDDAGARSVQGLMRQGGVNYDIGAVQNVAASYALYTSVQELNPATGVPFTVAEVNADEFGVDMIS